MSESASSRDAEQDEDDGFLAAVDLGSNSFHMIVARESHGGPRIVDRLRDRVGLAEGVGHKRKLDRRVEERALATLERFGQRLSGIPAERVRAVGTATFRRLRDGTFLTRAEEALGHGIEIVAGVEEARLVYLGVAHSLGDDEGRRLVVDIGGASTELVLGQRFEALTVDSLSMGCVTFSESFFPAGALSPKAMRRAILAARQELESLEAGYRRAGWQSCIGSSGTILAVATILEREGWGDGSVTRPGLERLVKAIGRGGEMARLELRGLDDERRSVLAGGVAVLSAVFDALSLQCMETSKGALREGLLFDLLGRIRHEDVRQRAILDFCARAGVDAPQAERVEATALVLFDQVADDWKLDPEDRLTLAWAARTHEVGLMLAYRGQHKHGAYMIANTNLRGFSQGEQARVAALVRLHRRKPGLDALPEFEVTDTTRLRRLTALLRLAAVLHRGRGSTEPGAPQLEASSALLRVAFSEGWLLDHPLTRADLEVEAGHISVLGLRLEFA